MVTVKKQKEFSELRCSGVREGGSGEEGEGECVFDL